MDLRFLLLTAINDTSESTTIYIRRWSLPGTVPRMLTISKIDRYKRGFGNVRHPTWLEFAVALVDEGRRC